MESARDNVLDGHLFEPGKNCWRVQKATRFRCVQDGEEHFRLVREAILSAQRTVFILGWDIFAGVDLLPGTTDAREPTKLAQLLDFVVRRNKRLHCYVLIWDYAAVYALERDPFSRFKLGWGTHRRVHFRYDNRHPYGASHHQKIVVVDDRIAFSGGLDLTGHRWDTPAHPVDDALRVNATGKPYTPFHDVQALVEGPVAASLGELARERWRRSGNKLVPSRLPPVAPATESRWPDVEADMEDVDVAISRTEPAFDRRPAVRECEALFIDAIASARRSIWVENQYFTNLTIAKALAARLREPDGPEIVVVGPKSCSGWLEEQTMGALRQQVLLEMTRADLHGRLRLTYAITSRERDVCTFIHSKIMVVDDEVLRIGSANLSSRSMGMDTECDLTVVAHGDARVRERIAHVRNRLMAEHLGTDAAGVAAAFERAGSLRGAVDSFAGNDRALERIEVYEDEEPKEMAEVVKLAADPDEPMVVTRAIDRLLPEIDTSNEYRRVAVLALPLVLLGAAWIALVRSGEIAHWFGGAGPRAFLVAAPTMPDLMLWALALSVAGGLMLVPLEVLVLGAIVLFGPLVGGPLALVAALIAAAIGYFAGRALGGKRVIPLIGVRAYRVGRELPGRSSVSVAVLRLVSAFSSASIHLLCGATRVPLRAYMLGTIAALVPIVLVLSLLGGLLRRTILHPGPWTAAATIATAFLLAAIALRVRRRLLVKRFHAAQLDQQQRAVYG